MLIPTFIYMLLAILCALVSMAFYTLVERKALGYIQIRKGPNKPSLMGIPVPFADAIKLFIKEKPNPNQANSYMFFVAPAIALSLALLLWSLFPSLYPSFFLSLSLLSFLAISSMSVYPTMGAGWLSNSKYALLGAFRAIAQTISYEVSMSLIFLTIILFFASLSIPKNFILTPMILTLSIPCFMWLLTIHAETNRSPFDFAEGESELVSGFNTEYAAGQFALIFMAEYTSILAMSMISSYIMVSNFNPMMTSITIFTIAYLFIWTRGTLPRLRYDILMTLTWKAILPSILLFFTIFVVFI